jgi:hypothetical protein
MTIRAYYSDEYVDQNIYTEQRLFRVPVGVKYILIHFYTDKPLDDTFVLNLSYQADESVNAIALYVSIAVITLICIMCSICFYRCSKSLVQNQHRGRVMLALNSNANNEAITGRNQQDIVRERNNEIIQKLFEEDLKPAEYTEELNHFKVPVCSICLEALIGTTVSSLGCKHLFHSICLKDWLLKDIMKPKCPNCNYYVIENQHDKQENENVLIFATNNPQNLPQPVSIVISAETLVVVRPPENPRNNQIE